MKALLFATLAAGTLTAGAAELTDYEPNLQDRCWMWGHDSGMYDKPGDPFNIPPSEKISMADACAYMGVSNVSVVIWYLPDEEYCAQFRNLKRVSWVVDNGDLKQYRGKDILAKHLEFAFRKFETMPNLMGVEFDDYFFQPQPPPVREMLEDGSEVEVIPGPRTLKEIRRTVKRLHAYRRPIDMRIVVYERDLGSEAIRPVVNEFDTVMFWTWTGANVAQLRENFARYRWLVPKKRTLLGIYMWDFGGKKPIGVKTMKIQLDFALEKFRCGEIDGVIFHCTPLVNKNLPEVEMCRRWIAEHGQERIGKCDAPRTFCNPLPLPELPKSVYINCGGKGAPHRQVSDPNLIRGQGRWYLYPSAGFVYESDDDGGTWVRHESTEGLEGHGPGAVRHRGKYYYIPRTDGEVYVGDKPAGPYRSLGKIDLPTDVPGPADPMLFSDDDGRLYFYWGCTARGGIWGCELDAENPTRVISRPMELIPFDPVGQQWERAANNPQNGWLEGAWMVKLNGRYCLTFSAGGAENETYAMGAYWSDRPLADFRPQRRNPFFISPKGLVTGTGHGSVVRDERGQLWVSYCVRVGSRHWFERLVGMDRLRLDANGEIEPSSATSEPQFLPSSGTGAAGWRRIPVRTQSAGAADESLQTFTWLLDLPGKIDCAFEKPQVVRSFRVCWREDGYDPGNGVTSGPFRYRLVLRGADGHETVAHDASASMEDRLVDYREITPTEAVAARLELLEAPRGIKAGVSDFALFGEAL